MRYVAAILIILLPFLYFSDIFNSGEQQIQLKELTIKNGSRQSIVLPDGSKVTLDAGSSLKYPFVFAEDKREVFLNGEAFFEVASDPDKPFIVSANQASIKVLGTSLMSETGTKLKKLF